MRTLRPRSHRRVFATIFVITIVIILAAVFLALVPKTQVDRELSVIRAAGLPATASELHRWYEAVPDNENGALAVVAAGKIHQDDAVIKELRLQTTEEFLPAHVASIQHYIEANRSTIEKLKELPSFKRSRFPADFSMWPATDLPHLSQFWKLAFLLKLEAKNQAARGNRDEAVDAVKSAFALARTLTREPALMSPLVRISPLHAGFQGLESTINQHQLSRQALVDLAALAREAEQDCYLSLHCAYVGERIIGMETLQQTYRDLGKFGGSDFQNSSIGFKRALSYRFRTVTGRKQQDLVKYLDAMQGYIDALTNKFPEMISASQRAHVTRSIDQIWTWSLPGFTNAVTKYAFVIAEIRCARAAIATELYRTDHNALPSSVDELVGEYLDELPRDPFDNQPLRLIKGEQGFRIISETTSAKKQEANKAAKEADFAVNRGL